MRRTANRLTALVGSLALSLTALTACGSGGDSQPESSGLDGVEISGEFGAAPEVTWDGLFAVEEVQTELLVEGDGKVLAEGDGAVVNLWIGNGFTQDVAYSSYEEGSQPEQLTVDDSISPGIKEGLLGQTIGSRVVVAAPPEDAFGETGNPNLGIGNADHVLFILDIMAEPITEPTDVDPDELPSIVENRRGVPSGFDFSGVDEPQEDGPFLRAILEEGDGDELTAADTVRVHYLGMTYGAEEPFDRSFGGEPVEFPLAGVVQGWTLGLTGVTVGSRVLLQIPPLLGYGANEQGEIPANSTLYFVIDVLEVVDPAEAGAGEEEFDLDDLDLDDLDLGDIDPEELGIDHEDLEPEEEQ